MRGVGNNEVADFPLGAALYLREALIDSIFDILTVDIGLATIGKGVLLAVGLEGLHLAGVAHVAIRSRAYRTHLPCNERAAGRLARDGVGSAVAYARPLATIYLDFISAGVVDGIPTNHAAVMRLRVPHPRRRLQGRTTGRDIPRSSTAFSEQIDITLPASIATEQGSRRIVSQQVVGIGAFGCDSSSRVVCYNFYCPFPIIIKGSLRLQIVFR